MTNQYGRPALASPVVGGNRVSHLMPVKIAVYGRGNAGAAEFRGKSIHAQRKHIHRRSPRGSHPLVGQKFKRTQFFRTDFLDPNRRTALQANPPKEAPAPLDQGAGWKATCRELAAN
jgi:hypothetical protein